MKKLLFTMLLATLGIGSASAQFEAGKKYIATTSDCNGVLSYSKATNFKLGLAANAGYMFTDDWMAIGEVGLDFSNKDINLLEVGAKCRYIIEQNGLFLQAGLKYVHAKSFNDLQVTPEIGYTFFLNEHVTFEPSLFYDISTSDFDHHSNAGVKVGFGYYF